jgi:glutamate N-acetyltransferase/amino-acid N-acetyltransferase
MAEPVSIPRGYLFAGVEAGLRKAGGIDLALIVSDNLASAAGAFTSNRVQAAPVAVSRENLRRSRGRAMAVVANAGNANCATPGALRAARATVQAAAQLLHVRPEYVLVASTGVIGVPLDSGKLVAALPRALRRLSPNTHPVAASAILTTDTVPKIAARRCGKAAVLGFAKGAGMIQPRLAAHATMLAFVMTDAAVSPAGLARLTRRAVERSFHRISVDGDTSTNDTVFVLANGVAGAVPQGKLARALEEVMVELAQAIAADGEGARKRVTIEVAAARSEAEAVQVARAIANSPLVKTALAGGDPNWGRILSAAGASGAPIDPSRVAIDLLGVAVCRRGAAVNFDEAALAAALQAATQIPVLVKLGRGKASARFWTCDLTEEYIRINASYRT